MWKWVTWWMVFDCALIIITIGVVDLLNNSDFHFCEIPSTTPCDPADVMPETVRPVVHPNLSTIAATMPGNWFNDCMRLGGCLGLCSAAWFIFSWNKDRKSTPMSTLVPGFSSSTVKSPALGCAVMVAISSIGAMFVGEWTAPIMTICSETLLFTEATLQQRGFSSMCHGGGAQTMFGIPLVFFVLVVILMIGAVFVLLFFATSLFKNGDDGFLDKLGNGQSSPGASARCVQIVLLCVIGTALWYLMSFINWLLPYVFAPLIDYVEAFMEFGSLSTLPLLGHSLAFYLEQQHLNQAGGMFSLDPDNLQRLANGSTTFRQEQNSININELVDEMFLGVGALGTTMALGMIMHATEPFCLKSSMLACGCSWIVLWCTYRDAWSRALDAQHDSYWCACNGMQNSTCDVMSGHGQLVPTRNNSSNSILCTLFLLCCLGGHLLCSFYSAYSENRAKQKEYLLG